MKFNKIFKFSLGILTVGVAQGDTFGSGANTFTMDFVTVGDPGNAGDGGKGSVDYNFRIGMYEVSEDMVTKANTVGNLGITQTNRGGDKPSTNVSWNEAARFVNWLNTSNGYSPAYKFALEPGDVGYSANANIELWTVADSGFNPINPFRNVDSFYFLPSEDEWYKAAYYSASTYFDYPTGSDSIPDGIDFDGDANFDAVFNDGFAQPTPNDIYNAGIASPWGTFGQGGNVLERVEDAFDGGNDSPSDLRAYYGGYWTQSQIALMPSGIGGNTPDDSDSNVGFRVASIPEPASSLLICFSLAGLMLVRRVP